LAGVAAAPGAVSDLAVARLCQDTRNLVIGWWREGVVNAFDCEDSGRDGADCDLLHCLIGTNSVWQQLAVDVQAHPIIAHGFDHNCLKRRVALQIQTCTLGSFYISWIWKTTLYIIQGQTTAGFFHADTSIKSTTKKTSDTVQLWSQLSKG
jgi:hypothetical protein